jgi:hypothetical protein
MWAHLGDAAASNCCTAYVESWHAESTIHDDSPPPLSMFPRWNARLLAVPCCKEPLLARYLGM